MAQHFRRHSFQALARAIAIIDHKNAKGVEMRIAKLVVISLLVSITVLAQNPDCRQSWMPSDAPAFCAWDTEPQLPEGRTYLAVTNSEKNIYVLGGYRYDAQSQKVIYYDSVLRSSIDSNGRLNPWSSEPSFKDGRSGASATLAGKCIFLAGGSSSNSTSLSYFGDIQSAHVEGDGHLSAWATSSNRLKIPRSNLSLISVTTNAGTFLNAVAGVSEIDGETVHLDSVEYAKIGADCSVGEWKVGNFHLKGGRSSPQALLVRGDVTVIGGWGDLDLIDVFNDVQIASTNPNGSPKPWRTTANRLPSGIYGHGTVFAENENPEASSLLLTIGGQPGTGAYANWISYAYVYPKLTTVDAIGIWRIAPTGKLPSGRAGLGVARSGSRLYVLGGNDAAGQYYRDVASVRFDFGHP